MSSPIDNGSTAFMMLSTALVQIMTPGVAFFYGGLVSDRSVVTMMMQSFVAMGIISVLWWFVTFSLCFGADGYVFGNPGTYFLLQNVNSQENLVVNGVVLAEVPGNIIVFFQMTFAIITPTLMTGAFADRLRFKPYVIFITIWHVLVYCPFAHMAWGGGWFFQYGVFDFAGGTVVHMTSGWSALGSLFVIGKRPQAEIEEEKPHNVPFVVLGATLLWFGWFGFNGGSALMVSSSAVAAYINSQLAAAAALVVWIFMDWIIKGKPTLVGACIGSVAGLVIITPCAGYVQPWAAVVLGVIVSIVCVGAIELRKRVLSRFVDDALDVWGCHGVGGFLGAILLGALADPPECNPGINSGIATPAWCANPNTVSRSGLQFAKQLMAAVICAAYCTIITPIILKLMSFCMELTPKHETAGSTLDEHEHGELAYHSPPRNFPPVQTNEKMFTKVTPQNS